MKRWFSVGVAAVLGLALTGVLAWKFDLTGVLLALGCFVGLFLTYRIFRDPQFGLLLMVFCLPFERIPSLDVGGVTLRLNFLFGILTLVSALWALGTRQLKIGPNPIGWPLALFFLISIVSSFFAVETDRALFVIVFTAFTVSLGLLPLSLLRSERLLGQLLSVLFASAAVVGVFGLYQFVGDLAGLPRTLTGIDIGFSKVVFGFPRIQAFSAEPLYLGNYLLLPLSLLLTTLLRRIEVPGWSRFWRWALFALLCLVLILTVSRGAYLAALASVFVIACSFPRELLAPKRLFALGLGGLVVGVGAAFFIAQGGDIATTSFQDHVFGGDFEEAESTQGRLDSYGQAFVAWEEHSWLGVGPGNFGSYSKGYPDPRSVEGSGIVNNEYLELLAETGIFGFAAMLILALITVTRSVVAYQATRSPFLQAALVGTTAALIGLAVQYNFFSTLYIIYVWVLIGLCLAVQTLALQPRRP